MRAFYGPWPRGLGLKAVFYHEDGIFMGISNPGKLYAHTYVHTKIHLRADFRNSSFMFACVELLKLVRTSWGEGVCWHLAIFEI